MKQLIAIACGLAVCATAAAQSETTNMVVTFTNGLTTQYKVSEVKSITFEAAEEEQPVELAKVARISVPTDFSSCRVQKVMYGGNQIAEIDYEYIKAIKDARVVIYPMGTDGKADLTKGISATDGGTVVWDLSANTATYTAGEGAVSTFYYTDGALTTATEETDIADATVEGDFLVDVRGSEAITYKIVKVGTQYWMAENLRATKYANGSDITLFTTADGTDAWTNNTTGAYHIYGDNSEVLELFGALYSGYAVINEAGLAPRGWEVPTKEQWTALRKAGGPAATNFKLDDEIIWNENQGTNITGFDAYPAGYYSTATSDTADTTDTYWWTSTTFYDFLTRSNGLETVRINDKATNMVVSDSAGHDYLFGHSVRCIRK